MKCDLENCKKCDSNGKCLKCYSEDLLAPLCQKLKDTGFFNEISGDKS